jgi:NAD+ kinase
LGGDGTFLRAAALAHAAGGTVLGVNLGRVGFLLPVSPSAVVEAVSGFLAGAAHIEERLVLTVRSVSSVVTAINEVVLERSQSGHMARVRVAIDGDEFLTYSADGVLVATPTGSTAYNFSAGGPVLSPTLPAMVVTPVAPHFTIDRSIVVGSLSQISLTTLERTAQLVIDGRVEVAVNSGESVSVSSHERPLRVMVASSAGLGGRLRESLREGHA